MTRAFHLKRLTGVILSIVAGLFMPYFSGILLFRIMNLPTTDTSLLYIILYWLIGIITICLAVITIIVLCLAVGGCFKLYNYIYSKGK